MLDRKEQFLYRCRAEKEMIRQEFERVVPEKVGIHSEGILKFLDSLESGYTEMHGLMIMRHGKVCAEGWWAPYAQGMHHMCASLTKTYLGTAIGIAIRQGLLTIDTPLSEIFPEYVPEQPQKYFDELTIRSVLTMSSGMTEFPSMEGNWVQNFMAMPLHYKPGTHFFYNSVGSTFLGKVIEKLTGKDVYTYLDENLFCRIGIDISNIEHGIAPEGRDMWAWRTVSTTEDNLRLMKLYADGGVWNGERILSEEYVRLATQKEIESASDEARSKGEIDSCFGYGFQMWMCQYPGAYRADGAAGQYSVVIPDKDMIIAVNEDSPDPQQTLRNIWNILIPAVEDIELPEDRVSFGRLSYRLKHLCIECPEYRPYAKMKDAASGKYLVDSGTFDLYCDGMFNPDPDPIKEFSIQFNTMEGWIKWTNVNRLEGEIEFALDGSRRYNRFASPWQFAKICYANGVWETDDVFRLELLWPENNSSRRLWFRFAPGVCTVSQTKGGMPGQPEITVETTCVKINI